MATAKATEIVTLMESMRDEKQREILMRFFKTGKGEYAEGDEFLGLKVPQTREIVKEFKNLPLEEMPGLLSSRWHEVRLCGLLILVAKFETLSKPRLAEDAQATLRRDEILQLYLRYAEQTNNWDLVDMSAPKILGRWLTLPTSLTPTLFPQGERIFKQQTVDSLAFSDHLWKQRISMVCSWMTSRQGDPSWCLRYAEIHLRHPHDLMHKAVGWMLREMGKNVSTGLLREFLRQHIREMPRTTLRYAIEKMDAGERRYWMEY